LAVVPIAAKSLSSVDTISLRFLGEDFVLNAELPFSWHVFFFSSLSFGIASLLYILFCPDVVRMYKKLSELKSHMESDEAIQTEILCAYIDALANRYRKYPTEIERFLSMFLAKYGKRHGSVEDTVIVEEAGYFQIDISGLELDSKLLADSFRAARIEADQTRKSMRALCWYLYLVGFALLFIVLLENLYFVSNSFVIYWRNDSNLLTYMAAALPVIVAAVLALTYYFRKTS